jgi:branched-subunit amino acid aminotransferase/4-amino-4-deoxychorismate lyase
LGQTVKASEIRKARFMSQPLAYFKGSFVPQNEVCIPLEDAGFIFGATVTDLCRTFRHKLYRLADHLERFRRSCRSACVPLHLTDNELTRICEHLVSCNARQLTPEQDLALVMFATPGAIGYYAGREGGPGDSPPTLGIYTFPLPFSRYARLFEQGAHLVVPVVRSVPAHAVDPRIKHRSRLHWWLADQEAQRTEAGGIALLLDAETHQLTETATANFLLVKGGIVISPPRYAILGGISLRTVEELCGKLGIGFEERSLSVIDCQRADEAMLSSTSYCLAGVSRINGQPVPWPGNTFQRLLAAWSERVGLDIRQQILTNR